MKATLAPDIFHRSTTKSLIYLARDIFMASVLVFLTQLVDAALLQASAANIFILWTLRVILWLVYWWIQGLVMTGLWVLGHDCGHGAFSSSNWICDLTGFVIHTTLATPYYSWKFTHALHHRYHAHLDKDEHWIPPTRSTGDISGTAPTSIIGKIWEAFEDTPVYLVTLLILRQVIGFPVYLLFNVTGQPRYPRWTNHLNPWSVLFSKSQIGAVIASDLGLTVLLSAICYVASRLTWIVVVRIYIIPWFFMSHWITMIVFLQHTDPMLPRYREMAWTYARGAASTVDRDFLGWQGRFFLHHIAHCHVVHHMFPKIPWYNTPRATQAIRTVMGSHYHYCDSPTFKILWNNFRQCQSVDAEEPCPSRIEQNPRHATLECLPDRRPANGDLVGEDSVVYPVEDGVLRASRGVHHTPEGLFMTSQRYKHDPPTLSPTDTKPLQNADERDVTLWDFGIKPIFGPLWTHSMATQAAIVLLPLVIAAFVWHRKPQNLPPGPPSGILGDHHLQVPDLEPYKKFAEWAKQYGPIISFWFGRTPVIVLHSYQAATDLLDKRGEVYSSRPRSIIGQEILADNMRILGMAYGEKWRKMRKVQHSGLNEKYALNYREFQTLESTILIHELYQNPNTFSARFQRFATSVVFSISYGKRIVNMDDPMVKDSREAANAFGSTLVPGRYVVESWPFLLWVPRPLQWFRWAQERRRKLDIKLYVGLFDQVKREMDEGVAKSSMSLQMCQDESLADMSEIELAYSAAAPFTAGIGTVSSVLDVFVLAMTLHPECTRRAQEELDAVVGVSRMPTFEDEDSLPYTRALVKETLRWRPVAPTAVAHSTTADDTYRGYHIPKGATVYGNLHAICHDEAVFPDPENFMPERFIGTQDPRLVNLELPYGFGRRICPGRHVANQSLFIVISRMLWSFNFSPYIDESGKKILPNPDVFTGGGLVRRPAPFKCHILPRDSDIEKVISAEAAQSTMSLKEWE
ncbi:hypothetical protein EVG20_g6798 [Dentipellis fragilis]|uniref:Fatty acid desaturase domain-containing protein n=1 Tax=Dentipellis fragilis TaxID=205917 RepID=A0A4Y9YIH8_9AGAM|nr:hypothetical protein EVG20_g6798 [Dentipellis fragilis]